MKTNRQWLESLTDKQLSEFLTCGLQVTSAHKILRYSYYVSIHTIGAQYTQSTLGIEKWLSMPQDYEIKEGGTT